MAKDRYSKLNAWAAATMRVNAGSTRAHVRSCHLTLVAADGKKCSKTAEGPLLVIGSHEACDISLTDQTVSRFHCEITLTSGGATIKDLGSTNDTLVDGVAIFNARLHEGAVLTLGNSRLTFSLGPTSETKVSPRDNFGLLVGRSESMKRLYDLLDRVANSDVSILLEGETGTGKDITAHSIHQASERADKDLIVVDCGSISPGLIESEFFGHMRGSFTGATSDKVGAFEAADKGTIFLDEIGELPLDMQSRLLRVLDSGTVRRVGSAHPIAVDVRVLAATNRDLRREVNSGAFRSDLYHRLAVLTIKIPSLRERLGDLPLLVAALGERLGVSPTTLSELFTEEFLSRLSRHSWPGNIRELRNHVESCVALHEAVPLPSMDAEPLRIDPEEPLRPARKRWLKHLEREYLTALLDNTGNNVSAAARVAGFDRVQFHRLLKSLGLR